MVPAAGKLEATGSNPRDSPAQAVPETKSLLIVPFSTSSFPDMMALSVQVLFTCTLTLGTQFCNYNLIPNCVWTVDLMIIIDGTRIGRHTLLTSDRHDSSFDRPVVKRGHDGPHCREMWKIDINSC